MPRTDRANGHTKVRVALFSPYDGLGMGHVRRNLLVTENLVTSGLASDVLMISGSHEASVLPVGRGIDHLTIPGLRRQRDGSYAARSMQMEIGSLVDLRSEAIGGLLRSFAPDLLIVDKKPRGVLGELNPVLRHLRGTGRTRIVLGLRDVLDDPEAVSDEWREAGYCTAVDEFYDAVWVYGDPNIYNLATEVPFPETVGRRFAFTGYLDQRTRLDRAGCSSRDVLAGTGVGDDPFVLCMVGGGEDGALLAESFARAELPRGRHGILVAGPFMPEECRHTLHGLSAVRPRLHVTDFVSEPTALIDAAERVICMGGYGATTEVVSLEKPALIVPRVKPRVEQLIRAERFAEFGLTDCLTPDRLSPQALSDWMRKPTRAGRDARKRIDLGGLERIPRMVEALLRGGGRGATRQDDAFRSGRSGGRRKRGNYVQAGKR